MDLAALPQNVQLRIFLLQQPQLGKYRQRVFAQREIYPVGHDWLQNRRSRPQGNPQTLPGISGGQTGNRHRLTGQRRLYRREFLPGVPPQLQGLFRHSFALLVYITQRRPNLQTAAGDLQPGEPVALRVTGDLVNLSPKLGGNLGVGGVLVKDLQKFFYPCQLQGRAEAAGEYLPLLNQSPNVAHRNRTGLQVIFQQCFVAHGAVFRNLGQFLPEIDASGTQLGLQLPQNSIPINTGQVRFVNKQKDRNFIPLQKLPQGQGVCLYAIGAADD